MSDPITHRWEEGVPHHPLSRRIFDLLDQSDPTLIFDWRSGGDGDNGETLMYLLDERIDQQGEEHVLAFLLGT